MSYKNWKDYTPQELVDLYAGEDWGNFFEFQCALDSIPFLPDHYGPEPEKVPERPDVTSWSVGGIMFQDKKAAEEVYSLITSKTIVNDNYRSGSIRTIEIIDADSYSYPKLKSEINYSQELYNKIKPDIAAYKERKEAWEKVKKNYKEVYNLRNDLEEEILELVSKKQRENQEYSCMVEKHQKYLKLADNNNKTALKFLHNSCPNYKADFPEFFEGMEEE